MDQLLQCPVCTLYLHNGITMESHLDTHPKDQVIKALCNLTANNGYKSRTSTPTQSERSYRSRSRTPATEDSGVRWNSSYHSADHDRYWRRTPSHTPKSTSTVSRNGTPTLDTRIRDANFENNSSNASTQFSGGIYPIKSDKTQQTYVHNDPVTEFNHQYVYYPDRQEDREIKYSRSAEYNSINNTNNVFTYNMPTLGPSVKLQTAMLPTVPRREKDFVKILPKPNNILVKTNVGGVQYITPGVKPVHVMVPAAPTFVQKNVQNNMIVSGSIPTIPTTQIGTKIAPQPNNSTNQLNQITSTNFTPGATVVTQNSQIIYREMVHNIDGKPFISSIPGVLTDHDNVTNLTQTNSMYQNVMVVDPFGNASCMYASPQQIRPKTCSTAIYTNNVSAAAAQADKPLPNVVNDPNRTLIIEFGPLSVGPSTTSSVTLTSQADTSPFKDKPEKDIDNTEVNNDIPGTSKGLKIISNIKVEVPVQHHKNLLNTTVDLTGPNDTEFPDRPESPEKILPDLEDNNRSMSDECTQPSTASGDSLVSNTFSVIKNVGNPPTYKDSMKSCVDDKIETDFSDSCLVPDLICNEKPSISPCSELSENGENSTERTPLTPIPQSRGSSKSNLENNNKKNLSSPKTCRNNSSRLNNIYVKKNKKILQIKNAKPFPSTSTNTHTELTKPPSPVNKIPENFSINKIHQSEGIENKESSVSNTLRTISIHRLENNKQNEFHANTEFDANTEEQSMDLEPVACSSINETGNFTTSIDVVKVKDEVNTSNEGGFNSEAGTSDRDLITLESIRPINVISYGNMTSDDFDEESNHRELLDLEAASKNKQFVNMMNENYFGDNIYADYFTADRVESFDSERETSGFSKEGARDSMYIWGETSQKESEFVLPSFIHESYKIAESSGVDYSEQLGDTDGQGQQGDLEGEGCERDSKADVLSESRSEGEPPLNICADERMPPRGELSGQESNEDMESPWSGVYNEVTPSEPYDLIARESWVSDGSEMDIHEKRDNLEEELRLPKARTYTCSACGSKFPSCRELRAHRARDHPTATYSRMISAKNIKKEEKTDVNMLQSNLMPIQDSKDAMATTMLQVYGTMNEAKHKIDNVGLIKQETKRRKRNYVCSTCKVDQGNDAAYQAHLKIHPLECLTCGKCFFRRANLALHLKMHLGIKNYKCDVCEKRFITRQKLMEHHNIHTGRTPIKCTVCDETFKRYSSMVQHRDRHHFRKKAKVRDFVCHCGAVFHSRAKLRWHKETHEPRPKACLYCSDKFVHASSLTRHVRRSHNKYYLSARHRGKVENVPCPVCKQIYLRTNLRAHLQTHSGKRPFVCVICNKGFTTKWNLKLHRWIHMSRSAKPYKCNMCKGAFIRQTEYISHMNAHKSVRPYTCNYCGRQFIRKNNCQRHVKEHETAKKYVCKVPECGKSFHRSYYLSEHMKVHSGVRPFSCNICGKTTSNKSNHNKHVKIHHAREPVATEA